LKQNANFNGTRLRRVIGDRVIRIIRRGGVGKQRINGGTVMGEYHDHVHGVDPAAPSWQALLEQSTDPEKPARFVEAIEQGAPAFAIDQARRIRYQNEADRKRKKAVQEIPADVPIGASAGVSATLGATSSPSAPMRAAPASVSPSSLGAPEVGTPPEVSSAAEVASPPMSRRERDQAEWRAQKAARAEAERAEAAKKAEAPPFCDPAQPGDAKRAGSKQEEPRPQPKGPQPPPFFWAPPQAETAKAKPSEEVVPTYTAKGPAMRWDELRVPEGITELERLTYVPGAVGDVIEWIVGGAPYPNRMMALATAVAAVGTKVGRRIMGPTGSATHLYMINLAPTGYGKDHPLGCGAKLFVAAGLGGLLGPQEFASSPGL
jgi:hypothetical protein